MILPSQNSSGRSLPVGLFLLLLLFMAPCLTHAQEDSLRSVYNDYPVEDSVNLPGKSKWQQWAYERSAYNFPAAKRNNWSVGVNAGTCFVSGDIAPKPGFMVGANVRKALGHLMSLRLAYAGGYAQGQNWRRNSGFLKNDALNGRNNTDANYTGSTYPYVYYNFRSVIHDATFQAVIHLNNINFYKENPRWGMYAMAGFGGSLYKTMIDATGRDGGIYDYSTITQSNTRDDRRTILNELKDLQDGDFETPAEGSSADNKFGGFVFNPTVTAGFAVGYKVNRRIEIVAETRLSWTNDDLVDGQRWEETLTLTSEYDTYHYTNLGINFRLGKGEESFWWTNPLQQPYEQIQETKDKVDLAMGDADGDGVADMFDQEPDTPEGAPVDSKGVTLDTDKDRVPDYKDKEPYSPIGVPVDEDGVALDRDNDGVPDGLDQEPDSPEGVLVDAKGRQIEMNTGPATDYVMPIVHFDLNKAEIKKEFFPELYYVGQLMQNNPDMLVLITGHTDVRFSESYNIELSLKRANAVKDFLVDNFGIDPSRFNVEYRGEDQNLIKNLPDNYDPKFEDKHYLNRRVEFQIIKK